MIKFLENRRKLREDAHYVEFGPNHPGHTRDTTEDVIFNQLSASDIPVVDEQVTRSLNTLSALLSKENRVFYKFSEDDRMISTLVKDLQLILDTAVRNGYLICKNCGSRALLRYRDDPELESTAHCIRHAFEDSSLAVNTMSKLLKPSSLGKLVTG